MARFVASCSCKRWIGYAGDEAAARKAGESHQREQERSPSLIQLDGLHVLTVQLDSFLGQLAPPRRSSLAAL